MAVPNKVIVPKNAHIPKTHRLKPGPWLPELEAWEGVVRGGKRDCVSQEEEEDVC